MIFEDIEKILNSPEYRNFIKARNFYNDNNLPASKEELKVLKKLGKLEDKKDDKYRKSGKKVYKKNPMSKHKGGIESYYKKIDAEISKSHKKIDEKFEKKENRYLSKKGRKQINDTYYNRERNKDIGRGDMDAEIDKMREMFMKEENKEYADTMDKFKKLYGKEFSFKVYNQNVLCKMKKARYEEGINIWWEINPGTKTEKEFDKVDTYIRKNIFKIFKEKYKVNDTNLHADSTTPDHQCCFIDYQMPQEMYKKWWDFAGKHLEKKPDARIRQIDEFYAKKFKKGSKKGWK